MSKQGPTGDLIFPGERAVTTLCAKLTVGGMFRQNVVPRGVTQLAFHPTVPNSTRAVSPRESPCAQVETQGRLSVTL